jgi:hypothetical protein
MESTQLQQCLQNATHGVEAFVLVGGTLLNQNRAALTGCVARGVDARFLFPSIRSRWLKEYVESAGIPFDEYAARIKRNAEVARLIGPQVRVRFHAKPVHSWFVLCDRSIVVTKPIGLFSRPQLEIANSRSDIMRFGQMFDNAWENSAGHEETADLMCFISYSRANADIAVSLKARLISRGIVAWRDVDDIPAGANWDWEIQEAICRCTHVLFVATSSSVKSENVNDELGFARTKGKSIVPLLYDECDLPLRIHRSQALNFTGDLSDAVEKLIRNLYHGAGLTI